MKYNKGNRFGKVEIVGVGEGTYNFLCDCGNPFSRSVASVNMGDIPRMCRLCTPKETTKAKMPTEIRPLYREGAKNDKGV